MMANDKFILNDDNVAVPEPDLITWALWLEKNRDRRRVARTTVLGGYLISTVFLGLDHGFLPGGPPMIFETMIFPRDSWLDEYCERCSTWNQALDMHKQAVRHARIRCLWWIIRDTWLRARSAMGTK